MANPALVNDFADKNPEDIKSNHRNSNIYLHIYACLRVLCEYISKLSITLGKLAVYQLKKS